ncbi:RagB/SusD family nutrient uptake outer membrane protein [Reichenbachiella carrageenanivorans]|uniref:RagB/SusD family nutrient uptake outer membrane protein n=1 Tax=Reichenbachiella carrageenanivorans TaxID=2979869 RepID=A0ABY6D562_9BACT|nr:RagB/SusD family nutrient uptake outer membrane protein [Reichenbachiella carrageenanivorans]UXX81281.1 RagB/SusD family nutrient uptake outer membrane protein [Reichenbachiella carrageenanivorans]
MKRILTLIILSVVVSYGCNDDFTKESPKGTLNSEVLQNAEGVDLLLTSAYGLLDGFITGDPWQGSSDGWWLDVTTDDAHKGSTDVDQPDLQRLQMYNWTADNPYLFTKWVAVYGGVDRANSVINLAESIEGQDFSAKIAEARFLRAHYHFELQRLWGQVSYISEADQLDPNIPNTGAIWDKIEEDYQFAIDNLPTTQPVPGRVTSWTAKAFLAKVHLEQHEYTEAIALFTDVINNGPYSLAAEFQDNFTWAGKNGSEAIMSIEFAVGGVANDANGNQGATLTHPGGGPYESCCGFYQPSQNLANAFQTDAGGLPLLDTYADNDIANDAGISENDPFTPHAGNLDPRIDYTIGRRGIDFNGYGMNPGQSWVRGYETGGPYLHKKGSYKKEEEDQSKGSGSWGQQSSGLNYNIMRYADLLLLAAEAEIEGGSLAIAEGYVNEVRNRAKNMTYVKELDVNGEFTANNAANYVIEPYPDGTFTAQGQAYARKAMRLERRLELGMEGHRYYDIRRYGEAPSIMNAWLVDEDRIFGNARFGSVSVSDKHNYLPIPIRAIDLSNGVLTQNDNWK